MGIEKLFKSIEENKIANLYSKFTHTFAKKIDATYFSIDFNSIVYNVGGKLVSDMNKIMYRLITNQDTKTIDEIIKTYNIKKPTDYKLFSQELHENFDKILVANVLKYILHIINHFLIPIKLEHIFIAVDGVPIKSKMIEQRKRRFTGYVFDAMKNELHKKYDNTLSDSRKEYEKYKLYFNRSIITPATQFMKLMDNGLKSAEFSDKLFVLCPNLKKYYCSGFEVPGEGEKKIMDYIFSQVKGTSKHVIASPDTDMTLLGMLLHENANIKNITILRFDQQKDVYYVIYIDKLIDNLYLYIKPKINFNVQQSPIINDIVFVLNVFGNDFVRKIESINVKTDFDFVIDKYCQAMNNKNKYLVQDHNIDIEVLTDIFNIISKYEKKILYNLYLSTHYKNYNFLKKILKAESSNFNEVMEDFLNNLRHFHDDIAEGKTSGWKNEFINILKSILHFEKVTNERFISDYISDYHKTHTFPKIYIFKGFSDNLDAQLSDELIKITQFDIEVHKLENMIEPYKQKLKNYKLSLGKIYIDYDTYTWNTEEYDQSISDYYKDFFGISNTASSNPQMKQLVTEYLRGLMWVYNYYYNTNDPTQNYQSVNTWVYPYERAPLIKHIHNFLQDSPKTLLKDILTNLNKFNVPRKDFFTPTEHLLYTAPINVMLYLVPDELQKFVKTFRYYKDLNLYAQKILNDKDNNLIDCRGAHFTNKCNLLIFEDDMSDTIFIKSVRDTQIKQLYDNMDTTFEKVPNKENYKKIMRVYKKAYKETKNKNYKTIYKQFRQKIDS